jgi:murein DD-endopeptidase MepM/ murein hydrolase activator NlpD
MRRVEPQSHKECRGKNERVPLLSMLLWLVVPVIAVRANSTEVIPALTIQPVADSLVSRPQSYVVAQADADNRCSQPVLSRLTRHKVGAGETLESIASRYNLIPATLTGLNPALRGTSMPVGREILIPPFNGIRVDVTADSTWQDIAETYGVRPDLLFEVNGCQQQPQQVFVPGVNWASGSRPVTDTYTGFAGYPLPSVAPVALSYGWYQNPGTGQARFHSGIDLLADEGTPVLSVEAGTVAFADEQAGYGNLVVINHQGGRQTRYAHLSRVLVKAGQKVRSGEALGTVGLTGRPDTEKPHLHFEVRYNSTSGWVAQDPELHLRARPTAQR